VTGARRDITNQPVDFTEGLGGVEILVSRRMSTLSGEVEGEVQDVDAETSELPADTAVLIFSDDHSQWIPGSTAVARIWPTEEGTFVAEGLPAGAYRVTAVTATPAGFLRAVPDVLRSLSLRATLVTLRDGETQQVRLPLARRE
jgi:hypothetical protein